MSRFHGRQYRGAMRDLRARRRDEAHQRAIARAEAVAARAGPPLWELACKDKVRYPTRAIAKRAAKRAGRFFFHTRMTIYRCIYCEQWHMAHPGAGTGLRRDLTAPTRNRHTWLGPLGRKKT